MFRFIANKNRPARRGVPLVAAAFLGSISIQGAALAHDPPRVVSVSPNPQSLTADTLTSILVTFDTPLDALTVDSPTVQVFGRWSGVRPGELSLANDDTEILFVPSGPFSAGEWVTVALSRGIRSRQGEPMALGYTWNFWTRGAPGTLELENTGTVEIRRPGEGRIQSYGAYAEDLDGDGHTDLTVPNELSDDVRVFLNDGTGTYDAFTIHEIPNGGAPSTNEGADFDGDGHIDIAVGNSQGDSVTVFLGTGTGVFRSISNFHASAGVRGLSVMDLDGDGDTDIVTANRAGDDLSILLNRGDGTFEQGQSLEAGGSDETACAAADANGDGVLDLFVGAYTSDEIILLLGDGEGGLVFSSSVPAGGSPWMLAAGDVNGDGRGDVVSANASDNHAAVILGDGEGGLEPAVTYPTGGFPLAIDLGDLDGDGDLDLVTSNYAGANWTVYENAGDGTFGNPKSLAAPRAGSCATLHDRDRDGDLDMTGVDEVADLLILFTNNPPLGIDEEVSGKIPPLPRTFALEQNHPNPFNPVTAIGYELPFEAAVELTIFDIQGRVVRTLVASSKTPGRHEVVWNGRDDTGRPVASGVYLYQLRAGEKRETRKMLLLR